MTPGVRRGMLLAAIAAGLSGVAVFLNSYGVRAVGDATAYTTAKNLVAGAVLAAVTAFAVRRGRRDARPVLTRPRTRWQALGLVAVAVVGGSVPFVLFFEGLAVIDSPVQAQLINKTLVAWVVLLAVLTLRERVGPLQLAAVAALLVGQVWSAGGMTALRHVTVGRGEALVLAATLLWAVEVVLAKTLLRSLAPLTVASARMGGGTALLLGWLAARGRLTVLEHLDARQWTWVLVTGVLLAAYVGTWLAALALAPAVRVTAVLVAAVPVTAVLQALVQHVALAPQLGGLALVVAGVAVALVAGRTTARAPIGT